VSSLASARFLDILSANLIKTTAKKNPSAPAGIMTKLAPFNALERPSFSGKNPVTFAGVSMWLRSIAIPGALTISYRDSSSTKGLF